MQRIRFQWTQREFLCLSELFFEVFHGLKPSFVGSFKIKDVEGENQGEKTGNYMQRIRFQWIALRFFFLNRRAISNRSARIFVPVRTFLQGFSWLLCSVHYSSVQLLPRDKGRQTSLVNRGCS
ncbi:unnamed protein product [Meganyctiphanes norvegica]|uniref:Uncharacterized protein n=1 Tax=Meganyctiphanes norvegica TaxID=48144 RepID=A0AAV2Q1A0_MEGNR